MTSQILIQKSKHADYYYDVSTPELLALASLSILKSNFDAGWYRNPQEPYLYPAVSDEENALIALTDEQISALPEVIRESTISSRNRAIGRVNRAQREFQQEKDFYNSVAELLALPVDEAIQKTVVRGQGKSWEKTLPLAFDILEQRSDYQYEGFEFETLSTPESLRKSLER